MTYGAEVVSRVAALLDQGFSQAEVSRRTGVSRYTVSDWVRTERHELVSRRQSHARNSCSFREDLPSDAYAYLLGLYLGDGCISEGRRQVYKMRIFLDMRYPRIIGEAYRAMRDVLPNRVGRLRHQGCVEMYASSKHWPCLFPQHGRGRKHDRPIVLEEWQQEIALRSAPHMLLRGLIHSDGSRFVNRVKGHEYPRYMFANCSADVRGIFGSACDALGIEHRPAGGRNVSVARRESVAQLDRLVGRKR